MVQLVPVCPGGFGNAGREGMRLVSGKLFKQLLLPGSPVAMHARACHTTAFAGHHLDELSRSLARLGVGT